MVEKHFNDQNNPQTGLDHMECIHWAVTLQRKGVKLKECEAGGTSLVE